MHVRIVLSPRLFGAATRLLLGHCRHAIAFADVQLRECVYLSRNVDDKYKAMCEGYAVYLSECPSFLHDICHEVRLDVFLL